MDTLTPFIEETLMAVCDIHLTEEAVRKAEVKRAQQEKEAALKAEQREKKLEAALAKKHAEEVERVKKEEEKVTKNNDDHKNERKLQAALARRHAEEEAGCFEGVFQRGVARKEAIARSKREAAEAKRAEESRRKAEEAEAKKSAEAQRKQEEVEAKRREREAKARAAEAEKAKQSAQVRASRTIVSSDGYMLSSLVRLVPAPGTWSLPSCDWFGRRVYALFPSAIGSGAGYMVSSLMRLVQATGDKYMLSSLVRLEAEKAKRSAQVKTPAGIVGTNRAAGEELARTAAGPAGYHIVYTAVLSTGCPQATELDIRSASPLCDWFQRQAYALFPHVIGSNAGRMLFSLV
eukprot:1182020-Prorocentrum_minimum.AAC.3